ncbi:hypothetical protein D3C81_1931520 [compost metagenome]
MPAKVLMVIGTSTALAITRYLSASSMPTSIISSGIQPSTGTWLMAWNSGHR